MAQRITMWMNARRIFGTLVAILVAIVVFLVVLLFVAINMMLSD